MRSEQRRNSFHHTCNLWIGPKIFFSEWSFLPSQHALNQAAQFVPLPQYHNFCPACYFEAHFNGNLDKNQQLTFHLLQSSFLQFLQYIWAYWGLKVNPRSTVRQSCLLTNLTLNSHEIHCQDAMPLPLLKHKIYMLLGISSMPSQVRQNLCIKEADESKFIQNCRTKLARGNVPSTRIGSMKNLLA